MDSPLFVAAGVAAPVDVFVAVVVDILVGAFRKLSVVGQRRGCCRLSSTLGRLGELRYPSFV